MERIFCKIKRVKRKLDGKRITAKVMSAVLIASSMLNAFAPVAAYASEPELATVSLSETQHGKLSFDGTEDMTLAVEVGTDVTVNVTPDEGYFSDGITVFKGEEDGTAVAVKDGKATFTVEGDTIVTSTFYENGTVGSAAFKSVDVDEGKAVTSVESYIRDHADAQYVGEGDELTRADVLTVTTSVVDGGKLPDATLDKLWADEDGDGFSEHWDALLSQPVSHAVLFEVNPDAGYYVGWAGADISGAKLTDWGASENNADAKMREGFVVDEATGLVYVPKSYTELNDKGEPMVASSRIQLVYAVEGKGAEAAFDFNSTVTDVRGDVAGKGKVSFPVTAASTKVTLATDDVALESLTGRTIDSVTVNGIEYTPDMGMWQYDADTGSLEFALAPAGIHAMNVKMSDNFGKGVASFFRMPEPRMSVNTIGTWEFKSAPWAGMTFRTSGKNIYDGGRTRPGYHLPAVENPSGGRYEDKTIRQAMGWQPVDLNALKAGNNTIMRYAEIPPQDTGTVKINQQTNLGLTCGHVGVGINFENNPNANIKGDEDGDGNEYTDQYGQHVRIFSVSGGEAIIGVTNPTSHSQAGAGFFKIGWRVIAGHINLHKTSANPDITNGNDCYSLEGAEFAVLNATGQSMGVLRTNSNGDTNTLELPEGTYTVRETKPPKGYLPAPDQQVTVHGGQTTTVQVADAPAGDPMRMAVGKFDGDKEYNANNLPQGSASLEGAEFTIEYFDTVDYDTYDALKKANVEPTRTWVFGTNTNGFAMYSEQSLIRGDDLYKSADGTPTLPRGSIAVYESKAPTGYKLNSDVNFQKIQENPLSGVTTFNLPEIPETVIRGGVSVQKLDSETGQTPQGGADFNGITFSIINDNPNAVTVDGKSHNPGQTVKTIVTDKNGVAKTSANCLPYGKYIIRETATNDDYLNTSNEMRVTVSEDGKMYSFTAKDDIVRGGEKITKHDIETGTGDPLGGASLDGTKFEIKTLNEKPVIVSGVTYTKGQVVHTLTIKDGEASTSGHLLPFGLYSIQEVKAGEGYLLTDGEPHEFRIAKDGVLVNPFDGAFENQVMRSDLEFTKKGDDGQDRLAGVAFKLTSKTTGESHVVVTDENGYFSSASSWNKHTHETNANDWALDAEGVIDSSKLDATAGVWFGGTTPDDSKGALPYDTYLIEELRCSANEGYQLIETSVIVSRDGKVYDFGTLTDVKASITTKAYDPMDGDSNIGMGNFLTIEDKVAYANLFPGRNYKLVAELHDAKTGEVLYDGKTVEHTFTAQEPSGFEVIRIDGIDTFGFAGKTITVYEKLYDEGGSLIAKHTDKDDVNQQVTVIVPEIGTTATDGADGDKLVSTDDAATVVDTVHYKNLIPGNRYALVGALFVKKTAEDGEITGEPLMVDGAPVVSYTTLTPETADGDADVTFTFDSLALKDGTQLVACEVLFGLGSEPESFADIEAATLLDLVEEPDTGLDGLYPLAYHADMEDLGQTVTIKNPKIATTALDGIDNDKNVVTDSETVIVDTVEYHNLVPGKEYTLKGSMQVKGEKDGKPVATPLEVGGEAVTAETTFTPEAAHGTVNVTFAFDSRDLEDGTQLVVFENLERNGNVLVTHEDIEDINQMVVATVPGISTSARDGIDGDKDVVVDDETTVIDTVEYKNLVPGKEYTLNGKLYSKSTGKPLMVDGKPVTAETVFTPEKSDGKVEVTFTFDSTGIPQDTEMVAFESLEKNGVELVAHADIEDGKQTTTAHVTGISTTATDGLDGDKNVIADAETTITDEVAYENALTGIGYTMTGILMDAETGLPILTGDGSEKYTEADVAAFMQQLLDVLGLSAQDEDEGIADIVVSDETAADGSVKKSQTVRVHADGTFEVIDTTYETDEDGLTSATVDTTGKVGYDALTDEQKEAVSDVAVLKDSGIVLNYSATGELPVSIDMDALGKFIADNEDLISHLVYQTAEFTPEKYDGTVTMDFHFNANDVIDRLGGETKDIVVFEVMSKNAVADEEGSAPVIVASECDLDSEEQTVNLAPTVIGTTATDKSDGDHTLMAGKDAVITDRVTYEGLIPGKEYTLKATLMDKKTGEMLSINDQHVTAELKFTPNSQNGTIDIDLGKFDASSLDGHDLVVFEELYKQTEQGNEATEVLVAEHKDIDDEGQTVTVTTTPPGGFFGKTGGNDFFIVVSIAALAVLACGCAYYGIKNRRAAKAEDATADEGDDTDNGDVSGDSEA